eukprot:Nk52_evm5s2426 gene=Nk52_evmTU5s2426
MPDLSKGYKKLYHPDLWYLNGKAYDFSKFVPRHPGGESSINLGKGCDCTELFQSYHSFLPSDKLLEKFELHENDPRLHDMEAMKRNDNLRADAILNEVRFSFKDDGFYRVLKGRAETYFKENGYRHTKATLAQNIVGYFNIFMCFLSIYLGFVKGYWVFWIIHGLSRALLIIRDTHAASHYSQFVSPSLNLWHYRICMMISGSSPANWTAKHVLSHHIDTNIVPQDDDTMYPMKRILPGYKRLWIHQFQHIYAWVFYLFTTLIWTLSNVLRDVFMRKTYEGVTRVKLDTLSEKIETYGVFAGHIVTRFGLAFVFLPFWKAVLAIVVSESVCSYWFALQFVVNHEIAENVLNYDVKGVSEVDWGKHQVLTSHNYSMGSYISLNLSGGLNLQIEHHLFPSVHFTHYENLRKIVQKTCKEFGISYYSSASFAEALVKHQTLLKTMGSGN